VWNTLFLSLWVYTGTPSHWSMEMWLRRSRGEAEAWKNFVFSSPDLHFLKV
jgi:hypothetical protein